MDAGSNSDGAISPDILADFDEDDLKEMQAVIGNINENDQDPNEQTVFVKLIQQNKTLQKEIQRLKQQSSNALVVRRISQNDIKTNNEQQS